MKKFNEFINHINEASDRNLNDIQILQSMFTTAKPFDLGYTTQVSVDFDEFIGHPNSFFGGNAFETKQEVMDMVDKMKELGATNIVACYLPVGFGWSEKQIREEPIADGLYFNAPDENFEQLVSIANPDEYGNFQSEVSGSTNDKKGKIRFWWD